MIYKNCPITERCPIYNKWNEETGDDNKKVISISMRLDARGVSYSSNRQGLGRGNVSILEHSCIALDYVNKPRQKMDDIIKKRKKCDACIHIIDILNGKKQ